MINPFPIAAVAVSMNGIRRAKGHGTTPSLEDPTQTLIPRQEHPRRQFVPTISIPSSAGKVDQFDSSGNVDPHAETVKTVKPEPAAEDDGMGAFVWLFMFGLLFVGGFIGYCIGVH